MGYSEKLDPQFMPGFDIRDSILARHLAEPESLGSLNKEELEHSGTHIELYTIAKLLPDLKYIGTPMKIRPTPGGIGWIYPNDYWIEFFRLLRGYLGHPSSGFIDAIANALESGELPPRSVHYLEQLYI